MKPYDRMVELLEACEEKPFAILIGRRCWRELVTDPRAARHILSIPGDPDTFHGVPVRVKGRRRIPQVFSPLVCQTAQDLHDALYPEHS